MKKIILTTLIFFTPLIAMAANYEITTPGNDLYFAGNVGIGTSVHTSALDVNGTVTLIGISGRSAGDITLQTVGGGNVGIASTAPGAKLDVQGTVRATYFYGNGSALTNLPGGSGTPGGSSGQLQWNSSSSFAGVSGSGVDSNGNLGIGSNTPGSKLDVFGTLRILSTGNVGINSVAPGQKLDVVGTGRFTQIIMNGTGNNTIAANLGIGSASPVAALDIVGTVRISGLTTGTMLCNLNGAIGHCSGSSSCLTTCTCTCVVP